MKDESKSRQTNSSHPVKPSAPLTFGHRTVIKWSTVY